MADVRLLIAGREYIVTCKDGEEPRLQTLGNMVDEMAREAGGSSGGLNESRLLLFSALLLADKLHDSKGNAASNAMNAPGSAIAPRNCPNSPANTLSRSSWKRKRKYHSGSGW